MILPWRGVGAGGEERPDWKTKPVRRHYSVAGNGVWEQGEDGRLCY